MGHVSESADASPFRGVVPYIVTPLDDDGNIKAEVVGRLCDDLINAGIHGITPLGSTGEYAYLNQQQRIRMIEITVEAVAGRVPVFAGVASVSIEGARFQARCYQNRGVDGVVVALDSYFPLGESEIESYFFSVADAIDLPMAVYTNPSFQRTDLSIDLIEKMSKHQNICAIKDASTNTGRLLSVMNRCEDRIDVLAASSHIPACVMMLGGKGWFSGPACLVARQSVALYNRCVEKRWEEALEIQRQLWPLNEVFARYNLAACIKGGLEGLGYPVGIPIPPQKPLSPQACADVASVIARISAM
jgi:4-hydroxy-tetrahydrodipicolinate synthase